MMLASWTPIREDGWKRCQGSSAGLETQKHERVLALRQPKAPLFPLPCPSGQFGMSIMTLAASFLESSCGRHISSRAFANHDQ